MQIYKAAKYIRLSYTDDKSNESDSVGNQRKLIEEFASHHPEIELVSERVDDGYSGVIFDRPAFKEMMDDIMEMSRSVLYGKRGGQYIADALKDAVIVVENKRLKTALIQLGNDLDSGRSLDDCLQELEMSFSNGEISSFCTVIKSLQSTGQVDEALRTLENNIEREQNSVNKRRCVVLEQKTTLYVILIAMDILGMLLYCIIMKLMEMQIGM